MTSAHRFAPALLVLQWAAHQSPAVVHVGRRRSGSMARCESAMARKSRAVGGCAQFQETTLTARDIEPTTPRGTFHHHGQFDAAITFLETRTWLGGGAIPHPHFFIPKGPVGSICRRAGGASPPRCLRAGQSFANAHEIERAMQLGHGRSPASQSRGLGTTAQRAPSASASFLTCLLRTSTENRSRN